jgi:hypothetical protein
VVSGPFVLEGDELIRVVGTSQFEAAVLELRARGADEDLACEG